jgi:hypothetical protein
MSLTSPLPDISLFPASKGSSQNVVLSFDANERVMIDLRSETTLHPVSSRGTSMVQCVDNTMRIKCRSVGKHLYVQPIELKVPQENSYAVLQMI